VAHVGVQRLGARHGQHHPAERHERRVAVIDEELRAIGRRERAQDARVLDHLVQPGDRQHREPERHHGAERPPDGVRPEPLDGEQHGEDRDRDRQHQRLEARIHDLEPFDRRQDRDRRRDHAVAVEQRGAEDAERHEQRLRRPAPCRLSLDQRDQRHDPALAVVVGAHDERHVLDRDDQRDRPEDERDDAVDGDVAGRDRAVVVREHRLQRVQRARADVAEDDPERADGQARSARLGVPLGHGPASFQG
jgi:hypothetical protein